MHKVNLPLPSGGSFQGHFPASSCSGDIRLVGHTLIAMADFWEHVERSTPADIVSIPRMPHLEAVLPFGAGGDGGEQA